jgi:thiamine-phosphate pyrophosphorylase
LNLAKPITYLITTGEVTDADFEVCRSQIIQTAAAAADAGVSLIQIREKNLCARLLFELTAAVVEATRDAAMRVLVNDRADIALAAEADGVHLTANSLPANVIRENFPLEFIVGVSTHNIDEVATIANSGADFAVFGPVFATPSKSETHGIDALREASVRVAPFPVLAIGGVDAQNVDEILRAGASGFASIRYLNDMDNLQKLYI